MGSALAFVTCPQADVCKALQEGQRDKAAFARHLSGPNNFAGFVRDDEG